MDTKSLTRNFVYSPENSLEVVVINNSEGDYDGYLELNAVIKILSSFVGKNGSTVWANASPSHKLIKNNKHYLHVFGLFKYLQNYNLNNKIHSKEYYTLKKLLQICFRARKIKRLIRCVKLKLNCVPCKKV